MYFLEPLLLEYQPPRGISLIKGGVGEGMKHFLVLQFSTNQKKRSVWYSGKWSALSLKGT